MNNIINKYINRIKSSYPEDDKLMMDLQNFYNEMKILEPIYKVNICEHMFDSELIYNNKVRVSSCIKCGKKQYR
jgi:DNA modification methylase